jgi:hypothetical protein
MGKKPKKLIFALVVLLAFTAGSCHFMEIWNDKEDEVTLVFSEPNITIMKGRMAVFNLTITPENSYDYLGVEYKVSNGGVASIIEGKRKSVTVCGVGVGSAIITAELNGYQGKAVLTVTPEL